jgi:hypothetical protein
MSKIAYQYNTAGMFIGRTTADESPLQPGVYLVPARCTLVRPPRARKTQWPKWTGTSWTLVARPAPAKPIDPVEKLRAFLAANPDVAAVLQQGGV